jgi:methionyl-tRNA formyltransferase
VASRNRIKIIIVTQLDSFVIPKNIALLNQSKKIYISLIVGINGKGTLENRKSFFIKGFGLWQSFLMGCRLLTNILLDLVNAGTNFRINQCKSLRASAKFCSTSYIEIENPNTPPFIEKLKSHDPDLIVSFSAPSVFQKELLDVPKLGCINLHCSVLPQYAGLLPSFWSLYEGASHIGATVHKMDSKIDNGPILGQTKMFTPRNISMYQAIKITKSMGGELMLSVIEKYFENNVEELPNPAKPENYYSWPTIEQMRAFRKKGGRLI